jgi:hypothetical protein
VAHVRTFAFLVQYLMQRLALFVFAIAALALVCVTVGAAFGTLPWIQMNLR